MYLRGEIAIDPSQLTQIEKKKPTRGFARMAYYLSAGVLTEKEEQETFGAVAVLQQINVAMRSIGVDDIVLLAKDDVTFYEDHEGLSGDLRQAMDSFASQMSKPDERVFETLLLVLEHTQGELRFLIRVEVHRTHRPGEFPIVITVNALLNELEKTVDESPKQFAHRVSSFFAKKKAHHGKANVQKRYDNRVRRARESFDAFLAQMAGAIQNKIDVDEVKKLNSEVVIVRPSKRVTRPVAVPHTSTADPVFADHHGYDNAAFYMWLWAANLHDNDIHCRDCSIRDENGKEVMEVGEKGFDAGKNDILNPSATEIEVPEGADVTVFADNMYSEVISHEAPASPLPSLGDSSGGGWDDSTRHESSGGWLSGMFEGFGDGSGGDSGSSCGGGGCGGCGGGE